MGKKPKRATPRSREDPHSLRAYARHRGCSLRAVQRARDSKRITLTNGKILDFELADREWIENTLGDKRAAERTKALRRGPDQERSTIFDDARTRRELAKAELDELALRKALGSLIPSEEVERATEARARSEREALLNWPGRIAASIAAELRISERKLRTILDREVRTFLAERSSALLGKDRAA